MATASHPIDVRGGNKYSDDHDHHDHEEHDKVLTNVGHEKAFVIPFVIGSIVTLSWAINNLVIQFYVQNDLSKNAAQSNALLNTVYHLSATSFVIQASTFAAGTAFAYYATQTQSGLYYLLSTVFNFIVVCVWFIYVVEPFGFMQWRHSSSLSGNTPFPTCFFQDPRPQSYNSDLCNGFKAASIFSFFLMVTHAIWTITHLMRAVRTSAFRLTAGASGFHSLINLFALINIASYVIWLGGRLALADKYNSYDASLVTYILTMSVAASTISSLSFVHNPTAASEFFGLIFNAVTSAMFASVVIMLARISDSSSIVSSLDSTLSTDSGKATVAAEFIMFLSTGITAVLFTIFRYFK